ncbi:type II secretion system protein [Gorillibacterium sp. CAU 1737]|uniref:type IV pilus modification PilV family protein n=1 Tax=Gorillibacterium sp. CAU 1737 TaxID=3140362 RepID=UPI00326053F9
MAHDLRPNQKGITLIEVLVSITILAIAVLAAVYALQQSTAFSKSNEARETNVQVARTVMEEIKAKLKQADPVTVELYDQTIDLTPLKGLESAQLSSITTPRSSIRIDIESHRPEQSLSVKGIAYPVGDYFRLIQVTCTKTATGETYSLKAYVESR